MPTQIVNLKDKKLKPVSYIYSARAVIKFEKKKIYYRVGPQSYSAMIMML